MLFAAIRFFGFLKIYLLGSKKKWFSVAKKKDEKKESHTSLNEKLRKIKVMRILVESILGKSLLEKGCWLSTGQGGNKVPILKLFTTSASLFFTSSGCSFGMIRHLPHFGYSAGRFLLTGLLPQLMQREKKRAHEREDDSKHSPRLLL